MGKLTEAQARVLSALGLMPPKRLAEHVYEAAYGKAALPGYQSTAHCLARLRAAGLASKELVDRQNRWTITAAGRSALSAAKPTQGGE